MKIDASLADELRADGSDSRQFAVIVSFNGRDGLKVFERLGIEPGAIYQSIAAAAAVVTAAQVAALAAAPEVVTIELDGPAQALRPR
jgi:hypothetical protein